MKVLLVASEVAPLIKLGGLGDVIGSLPKALSKLSDVQADVIIPFFPTAKTEGHILNKVMNLEVPFDTKIHSVEVYCTKLPESDVSVYLLRNEEFFAVGGKSAFQNNISETEMFGFFNRVVVEFLKARYNTYDLVHCNDWHTGLIPHILEDEIGVTRPATLLTIHNLSYQGMSDLDILHDLDLNTFDHSIIAWDAEDNNINMLQQGLASADYLSTVSPTYAKEILTSQFGNGLEDILNSRVGRLVGILNGLDYSQFPRNFTTTNWSQAKPFSKRTLQQHLGLPVDETRPLYSFVSRLDANQKGLDILFESMSTFIKQDVQFVLLGTGSKEWEDRFKTLAEHTNASINIMFDVDLAISIYEASDFLLVPSKFEPCGLTQMIAMWYGALPIVHATGGLKDSVDNAVNGFVFDNYSSKDLTAVLNSSLQVFEDTNKLSKMIDSAMASDFSWDKSAQKYLDLYKRVLMRRQESLSISTIL
ncbi:glycogen synthase [candidate division WWE3 bacterium]|uniref:Glycogen synthase n=1 Tax=candidate division WWE3 bacterium TaxID=2053526 RepID=A0A955J1I0_UNCKA|nr:glycogen synthase [candidate division WWE3 bacterium]